MVETERRFGLQYAKARTDREGGQPVHEQALYNNLTWGNCDTWSLDVT
jgi:hypothetical protein